MILKTNINTRANQPEIIADIFRAILESENEIDRDKEHFWVMGCDTAHKIKYIELVSLGILDASVVHPREVFRLAIMKGVKCIVIAHNHPSGEVSPSPQDNEITKTLKEAGKLLWIPVLDHVIIGNGKHYSYARSSTF